MQLRACIQNIQFSMATEIVNFTSEEFNSLRQQFEKLEEETLFNENPNLASLIACLGMHREIGSVNDELARFIFDADTKRAVSLSSLRSSIIKWNGLFGVVITSTATERIELRSVGFYDMIYPALSHNKDGTLHSLYIFPDLINEIMKLESLELVIVKSWAKNSIFGGFDPTKGYYQTNFWEIENNDALKFSDLVRRNRVAFLGTHDLIAHIAGAKFESWTKLKQTADEVYCAIKNYFDTVKKPTIAALILPYTIGVVLDDLAQPPSYGSQSHIIVLQELLLALKNKAIAPDLKAVLTEFPQAFEEVIRLSRQDTVITNPLLVKGSVKALVAEIKKASVQFN